MGLHQSKKLLCSKRTHQQNEKEAHCIGWKKVKGLVKEYICITHRQQYGDALRGRG